jgi:hypothetical protein
MKSCLLIICALVQGCWKEELLSAEEEEQNMFVDRWQNVARRASGDLHCTEIMMSDKNEDMSTGHLSPASPSLLGSPIVKSMQIDHKEGEDMCINERGEESGYWTPERNGLRSLSPMGDVLMTPSPDRTGRTSGPSSVQGSGRSEMSEAASKYDTAEAYGLGQQQREGWTLRVDNSVKDMHKGDYTSSPEENSKEVDRELGFPLRY